MDALGTPEGEVMRRHRSVSAGTFLRVARADWSAADSII